MSPADSATNPDSSLQSPESQPLELQSSEKQLNTSAGWVYRLAQRVWILFFLIRILFQDRFPYLATIYYATPPLILAFGAAAFGIGGLLKIWLQRNRSQQNSHLAHPYPASWRSIAIWFLIAVGCLLWTLSHSFAWTTPDKTNSNRVESKEIKVVFWNTARGFGGWENVAKDAKRFDADVIGFVEAGAFSERRRAFWKSHFPNHHVSMLGGGFVLLTQGEASECTVGHLAEFGESRSVDVTIRGKHFRVILVDVESNPIIPRKSALLALAAQTKARSEIPTMILGDFNTPTDSVHLRPLRENFRNAFETAGNGYAPTWPARFPLLILDQIWISPEIELKRCQLGWAPSSDHRPVMATIKSN